MESRAYLALYESIRWGAHVIEADLICSKHRSKTHTFGVVAQGEILASPLLGVIKEERNALERPQRNQNDASQDSGKF